MSERESPQVFRYRWSRTARVDVVVGLLVALFLALGIDGLHSGSISRGLWFLGFALASFVGFVVYRIAHSTIMISESGIAARVFGIPVRSIKWQEVIKIVRFRFSTGKYQMLYSIYPPNGATVGFDEAICDLRTLLDRVNVVARKRQIPIVSFDREGSKERSLPPNPPWRRRMPRGWVETPIDSL